MAAVQRRVGAVGERREDPSWGRGHAGPRGGAGRGGLREAPATRMRTGVAAVAAVREVNAMAGSAWVSKVRATGHQARGQHGRADCDPSSCLAEAIARGPVETAHGPRGEFRGVWPARRAWLARSRDSRALGGDGLKVKAAGSAPGVPTRLLRYWSPGLARSPGRSRNGRPGPAALLPAGFGAASGTAQVAPPRSLSI